MHPESLPLPPTRPRWAIACVIGAMVLVVLDAAIANVALPTIGQALAVAPSLAVHVVTAYQLALVMALLPCAALGESIGYRRVFVAGVAVFVTASALCALAPTFGTLLAARFLQGLGGAAVMSLAVALLRHIVPAHRLGVAIGWNALTVALTSAAGPVVGASILSLLGWRWLFAINVPIGIAVFCLWSFLPFVPGKRRRIDIGSVTFNALAFAAMFVGAELVTRHSAVGIASFVAPGGLFAWLIRRELVQATPLFPVDLLRALPFRLSVVASVLCFIGQTMALIAMPFYLQRQFGLDTLHVGLLMTPWPLAVALCAPVAGRLADRMPNGAICATGGTLLAMALAGLYLTAGIESRVPFVACTVACGAGFGIFVTANNRNMFMTAPAERSGAAGGMQGTARLTGQTTGAVLLSLLLASLPPSTATHVGFGASAIVVFAAALVSLGRSAVPATLPTSAAR